MLLASTVIAAIAFSATSATAQESEIEVDNERTSVGCNPCTIHAEEESHLRNLFSGNIISRCHDERDGTINHDGTRVLTWVGLDYPPISDCAAQ